MISNDFYIISAFGIEKPIVSKCSQEQIFSAFQQELMVGATGRCGAIITDSMTMVSTSGEGQNEEKWWFEAFSTSPECTLAKNYYVDHEGEFFQVSDYRIHLSGISLLRRFRRFSGSEPRVNSIIVLPENLASNFVNCLHEREKQARKTQQFNFFIQLFDTLSSKTAATQISSDQIH